MKRELSLTSEEIERTAIHEAGHAVCYVVYRLKLWRVEILPKGLSDIYYRVVRGRRVAGACLPTRWGWARMPVSQWREYTHAGCAGYAAEYLFYKTADKEGSEQDFEQVNRFLAEYGKGASLEMICDETIKLLKQYIPAIRTVADELLICKRLTGARVKEIVLNNERRGG
jgi:ATP-dependent Zn protease